MSCWSRCCRRCSRQRRSPDDIELSNPARISRHRGSLGVAEPSRSSNREVDRQNDSSTLDDNDDAASFYSCNDDERGSVPASFGSVRDLAKRLSQDFSRGVSHRSSVASASGRASLQFDEFDVASKPRRSRLPSRSPAQNLNKVSNYGWLREIMLQISEGGGLGSCRVVHSSSRATPIFVVAGSCPNNVCSMQAVCYYQLENGNVDLWWVKPSKSDADKLERETLNLHNQGSYKNDCGDRARKLYQPLADRFSGAYQVDDGFAFGIDDGGRAFIEEKSALEYGGGRMLLYFVWQEAWSRFMERSRWISGKLVYQRKPRGGHKMCFFARQYKIVDGTITIAPHGQEERLDSMFPPDSLQEMYDM